MIETQILPTQGTQVIDRAVLLLRLVATFRPRGARLTDLAAEAGLPAPTARRILKRLADHGLVAQEDEGQRYSLGRFAYELGLGSSRERAPGARHRPLLERIAAETGATSYLLMRSGLDSLCLDRVLPPGTDPVTTIDIGDRLPLGVGVGGMILLAELPPAEAEEVIRANAPVYPRFVRTTGARLHDDLARAVQDGHVIRRSPVTPGIVGFGMPLRSSGTRTHLALAGAFPVAAFPPEQRARVLDLVHGIVSAHMAGLQG